MDLSEKLSLLADAAKYDASCSSSGSKTRRAQKGLGTIEDMGICHSYTVRVKAFPHLSDCVDPPEYCLA